MSRSRIYIKEYNDDYKQQLLELLEDMSLELFGYGSVDLEDFVSSHWAIYLAITNNEVIGLSSYLINDYFGLRESVVGNSYLFVKPEYRKTRATYLLSIQSGFIVNQLQLPLEHYYTSEESAKLSRKLNGTKAYTTYIYEVDEVNKVYNRLEKTIKE